MATSHVLCGEEKLGFSQLVISHFRLLGEVCPSLTPKYFVAGEILILQKVCSSLYLTPSYSGSSVTNNELTTSPPSFSFSFLFCFVFLSQFIFSCLQKELVPVFR